MNARLFWLMGNDRSVLPVNAVNLLRGEGCDGLTIKIA